MTGRLFRVRGLVQGVGFRPQVWRVATELGLSGWVRNDGDGVTAAVNGENWPKFGQRLRETAPRLARIDSLSDEACATELPASGFVILDSEGGTVRTAIGPDAAICPECIADICNPDSRRWRYAFTTCTHCGPRYTVSHGIPYDRARTSMAGFPLCPACAGEYTDLPHGESLQGAVDRRFHAETTACPACGPKLSLRDAAGQALPGDPIAETLRLLRAGRIVAIKGLGGFHLACDARNPAAVAELRQRKQREAKPFAVMGLNEAAFAGLARIGDGERALLRSIAAPIVLCAKDPAGAKALPGVAPGLAWLGVMLPATPVHLLLWHEAAGRPAGTDWLDAASDLLLVMTSANPHGEPLVIDNDEALERLAGIADAFLCHDREIVIRCDDSVVRATPQGPAFIRRARGHVPVPIALADDGPTVLALGGYLKNTVCVMKGREAWLSQHIGGLDNVAAIGFLEETVAHLLAILDVRPDIIAHDLHPDYPSTHLAQRLADAWGVPALAFAHHAAHLAAICAEQGVIEPVIGLALDGVGLGADGGAWGGELLALNGSECKRLGHLRPLALPGGDRAAREPWRIGVSALHQAGEAASVASWERARWPGRDAAHLLDLLARNLRCPLTSSLGRHFDAAAGLLGVCDVMQYEGQAAMLLEGLAAAHGLAAPLAAGWRLLPGGVLDLSPLWSHLRDCADPAAGAACFHATLAAALADWVALAPPGDLLRGTVNPKNGQKLLIGGGCAMNAVLMAALRSRLTAAGFSVLEAWQAPPNDGGLALGQAWLARQSMKRAGMATRDIGQHDPVFEERN